jgi:hypothetical protein
MQQLNLLQSEANEMRRSLATALRSFGKPSDPSSTSCA